MSDDDPMIEIKASFFVECEELLESLQDGLQIMDDGDGDDESINVVFRAVHSIKGGAGAFGLNQLVRFAHQFESVLDGVRSGAINADRNAISVFFQSSDILADLVRSARDETATDEGRTQSVLKELETILGHDSNEVIEEEIDDFQPMALVMDLDLDSGADKALDVPEQSTPDTPAFEDGYTISFIPNSSLYVSGNEPLHLLRLLHELGQLNVICDTSAIPPLADIDVEKSYLSWTIQLTSDEDQDAIRDIFDFVADLCTLTISGPGTEAATTTPSSNPPPLQPLPQKDTGPPQGEPPAAPQGIAQTLTDPTHPPEMSAKPEATMPTLPASASSKSGSIVASKSTKPRPTVRVDLERIDRLVNLVGELVLARNQLVQHLAGSPDTQLANTAQRLDGVTGELQAIWKLYFHLSIALLMVETLSHS